LPCFAAILPELSKYGQGANLNQLPIMKTKPYVLSARFYALLLFLLAAAQGRACDTSTFTITNLPAITNYGYQVFGLNATGQLAGFYYVALVHPAHAFVYDKGNLTDLLTLGGLTSTAYAINDAGAVAGQADLAAGGGSHAFLYRGGPLLDLGTLGGTNSSAVAINNAGKVAGNSTLAGDTNTVGFIYTNGPLVSLGTLGGHYSVVFGLNQSGTVVGESSLANGDTNGFVYTGGVMTGIGTLGGHHSSAFAINDAGMAVGDSSLSSGATHGIVYAGVVLTDMGTLGGTNSTAYAINAAGQAIGVSTTAGETERHGFVYQGGAMTDLHTLGGNYSAAFALNNPGQIVGESGLSNGVIHAFIYQAGQMTDLNTLLPAGSGWELQSAYFINDAGRIVGVGTANGLSEWFILDLGTGTNQAPVAIAGPDQTVNCPGAVTLDGSQSSDPNGDPLTFAWSLDGKILGTNAFLMTGLPLGTNVVTLKVTDPCGASSETNVIVRVVDTNAPVMKALSVNPRVLFPPNHKLVPVKVTVRTCDTCDLTPVSRIVSIVCNQPLDRGDIQITGPLTAKLAATRDPRRGDRIYTITVECKDASGNKTRDRVTVTVPKDQGHGH
jgi:probable HAF family extracellular repeat protein